MTKTKTYPEVKQLQDGRSIFTTHNGFRYWCIDKKERTQEVTQEYYNKALTLYKSQL